MYIKYLNKILISIIQPTSMDDLWGSGTSCPYFVHAKN